MRVHVWAENKPLIEDKEKMYSIYPEGIEGVLALILANDPTLSITISRGTDDDYGLSDSIIKNSDVMLYWSHKHWREIPDERVDALQKAVLEGMGLVLLHSAHASKIFSRLLGTRTQALSWHESGQKQRVVNVLPSHPIAKGIGESFIIKEDESYSEYFEIPTPDELVFLTVSEGMDVIRSGCCFKRGRGRIFYFSAGHETYPVYYCEEVRKIIHNAVLWAGENRDSSWPTWAREKESVK